MGATAAHRVPERVADGTCTQIWAWMTNKCKRRMNEREGYIYIYIYITSEISQGREERERLLGSERSWEFTSSDEESFLPGT